MENFKTIEKKYVNVIDHTNEILNLNKDAEIHIGTDSQNSGRYTVYSTVIAYRLSNNGVHYIYSINKVSKITDKFTRLFDEVKRTIDLAIKFRDIFKNLNIELDFDFNNDKKYFSNILVNTAVGWAESLQFKANVKPNNVIATYAADYTCR